WHPVGLPGLRPGRGRAVRPARRGPRGRLGAGSLPAFPAAHPAGDGRAVAADGDEMDHGPQVRRSPVTRNHRRWHAWVWLVLGPVIDLGFVVGLLVRPAPVVEPAPLAAPGGVSRADAKTPAREATP